MYWQTNIYIYRPLLANTLADFTISPPHDKFYWQPPSHLSRYGMVLFWLSELFWFQIIVEVATLCEWLTDFLQTNFACMHCCSDLYIVPWFLSHMFPNCSLWFASLWGLFLYSSSAFLFFVKVYSGVIITTEFWTLKREKNNINKQCLKYSAEIETELYEEAAL